MTPAKAPNSTAGDSARVQAEIIRRDGIGTILAPNLVADNTFVTYVALELGQGEYASVWVPQVGQVFMTMDWLRAQLQAVLA